MQHFARQHALKQRIRSGQPTCGLFIKIPAPQIIELMAAADFDFLVLDAEHAPFGVDRLDSCLLAARAVEIPVLVRVPDHHPSHIQNALDLGAAGVIIPHITSAQDADAAVSAATYRQGRRGFAASHRAARYGALDTDAYREASDNSTIIIGQMEDAAAVDAIDQIAAIPGLDALFIGCADLAVSYGFDLSDTSRLEHPVRTICEAGRTQQKTLGIFLPDLGQVADWHAKGISLYFIASDQTLLTRAADNLSAAFKDAFASKTP
ncbi:HpcH/HpaI aldolase family protein [Paremcibacter congregatus]|uniref:HpcH/HpaI aldolase family protein n=1 Tax=Paremcibacter congregatus TaxID=2043170 RepID=UPI0030EB9D11